MKMTKDFRLFAIVIVSVLILIFGALIGILLLSVNYFSDNISTPAEVVLNAEDFDNIGVNVVYTQTIEPERIVSFENHYFTYDEFSRYFSVKVYSKESLMDYLRNSSFNVANYTLEQEVVAEKRVCDFDDVYKVVICTRYSVLKFSGEDPIIYELQRFVNISENIKDE